MSWYSLTQKPHRYKLFKDCMLQIRSLRLCTSNSSVYKLDQVSVSSHRVCIHLTSQYDENGSGHLLGCPGACTEPWWHGSPSPCIAVGTGNARTELDANPELSEGNEHRSISRYKMLISYPDPVLVHCISCNSCCNKAEEDDPQEAPACFWCSIFAWVQQMSN